MTGSTCKYNKVTQQQKFHLLTLVLKDKLLIKQAAKLVQINYSTAKTIIFFHRNHAKSYQFDFKTSKPKAIISTIEAIVSEMPHLQLDTSETIQNRFMTIDIISTIGSKMCDQEQSFYQDPTSKDLPLNNYPLTHKNLHAQQKSISEDILTQPNSKRVTRSQTGSVLPPCPAMPHLNICSFVQNPIQSLIEQ